MANNKNNNGMPEREFGGIEYAIVRDSDGAYLFDSKGDGTNPSWESYIENGSWWGDRDIALANASTNGLTEYADGIKLISGYHVASRPWYYDDDLIDDATETCQTRFHK